MTRMRLCRALALAVLLPVSSSFKVIGVGFPKTGLANLEKALELLQFKVYRMGHGIHHGGKAFHGARHGHASKEDQHRGHLEDLQKWLAIINSESYDQLDAFADRLVDQGFDAILDVPLDYTRIALRLIERYPDAKVVLTEHIGKEEWFEQYRIHMKDLQVESARFTAHAASPRVLAMRKIDEAIAAKKELPLVPRESDADRFIAAYDKHSADVKAAAKSGQLLVMPEAGWQPLCTFLNREEPLTAYPTLNTAAYEAAHLRFQQSYNHKFYFFVVVILGGFLLSVVHWAWNKHRSAAKVCDEKSTV
eukprot:CAMPEP_0197649234 /NCGR_PEP_ID=MMETSP1338-20131121/28233_1 /TAXON_ID=43686 ORGANISM="Pelagodinium beii, Strain RCC1491" /NCGR_SAMPLE_ID=MMETSP1338 /ASSEMBLY_ACC=CAM_ASM_000754 /LENGTH=305 /DNA_ID=CAMNT_0043223373 /DNA_START=39 /DNA_END=956 /DNA_ORIENTATION=+